MEIDLKIEKRKVADLLPYARNARTHSDTQVKQLAASIKEFGFNNPVAVDADGMILCGHGRVMAAKKLGLEEVPTVCLSHLSPTQVKAYILADNKLALNAGWDNDMLKVALQELKDEDFDIALTGFSDEELNDILVKDPVDPEEDDFAAEPPEVAKCERGDVWTLGDHRLMCGDSTSENDIKTLMQDEKADLLLTDPPYGVKRDKGFGGAGGFNKPIKRRVYTDDWDSETPSKECFNLILSHSDKAIIWGGNFFTDKLPVGSFWLVWDKHQTMPTFGDCELAWTNIDRKSVKKYDVEYNGLIGKEKERYHPTQKPTKLIAEVLKDFSKENGIVLDCFGGSGTTLIACENLHRACRMMESDEHYCDVIINRWQKLTGKEAVRADGVKFNDL